MNKNVVAGVDISKWATEKSHEKIVSDIYKNIKTQISRLELSPYLLEFGINKLIQNNPAVKESGGSPVTAKMILETASRYKIDPALIMAIAQADSSYGTKGKGSRGKNPGNWGNDDLGNIKTFETWDEGVDVIGRQLARYRDSSINYVMPSRNISYKETINNKVKDLTAADLNYKKPIDYSAAIKSTKVNNTKTTSQPVISKQEVKPVIKPITSKYNQYINPIEFNLPEKPIANVEEQYTPSIFEKINSTFLPKTFKFPVTITTDYIYKFGGSLKKW